MRPLNVFVAPRGNAFMTDIAGWLVEAGELLGRTATLRADGTLPDDPAALNLVVAPHEFYLLGDYTDAAIHRAAQISAPVCTEQPGTPWFDIGTIPARVAPLVLDINTHGVAALTERGLPARHLRLGGVPSMNATGGGVGAAREIDLVYLAGATDRRGAHLATLAPLLWDRHAELRLFTFSRPVDGDVPGLVFGRDKYELLARSRILLNIHRSDGAGYFEWARFLEAMANGCCIVTEPVDGYAPFVAGEHFVVADDLPATVARLLADPGECARVGAAAQRAALDEFPLTASLGPILDELEHGLDIGRRAPHSTAGGRRVPKYGRHLRVAQRLPLLPPFQPNGDLRLRAYQAMVAETALQRRIDRARCLVRHGRDDVVQRTETPAYAGAAPAVSVIVTLFDYGHLVTETLDSLVRSEGIDYEIVVVDDHSRDDGRAVVQAFMDAHPDVPLLLLGSEINRGLPAARNLGFSAARAANVMVMDADNMVYPSCLRKLADTLAAHPDAAFAYATLECFGERPGVASAKAWYVPWLCEANYIDAQAMLRKSAWERAGGYRTDDALVFGWEDWELWLRLAVAGEHGVHVPQMLGRYRTQAESMITTTNLVADHMIAHLRELHPTLPWPP
ncbi:MAG TPA: glycosyltransferase [Ilumatobacter sp.]|nr:glycosyltransferase [Ilumatobacter sp.]